MRYPVLVTLTPYGAAAFVNVHVLLPDTCNLRNPDASIEQNHHYRLISLRVT